MSVKFFPFNSIVINGVPDRPANAETFAAYMGAVYKNGVLRELDTSLQVKASSGMEIQILYGSGIINGKIIVNDSVAYLTVDTSNPTLKRIDRVVFRLNVVERLMEFAVLKGTPTALPEAPALTRNDQIYEMCLAEIAVGEGVTEITNADITDTRLDDYLCGWSYAFGMPNNIEEALRGKVESIVKENVAVATETFVEDLTYADYPYKAVITVEGVDSAYIPDVTFDVPEASSGNFAAVSVTDTNAVIIYAKEPPAAAITIPTIECRKRVE